MIREISEVFPAIDHIYFHFLESGEHRSKRWLTFLDDTGTRLDTSIGIGVMDYWGGRHR